MPGKQNIQTYNSQATSGGSFNALINSGIVHPIGILLIPYISSVVATGLGDYAWRSPFDTRKAINWTPYMIYK